MRRNDVRQSKKLELLQLSPNKMAKSPGISPSSELASPKYLFRPFSPIIQISSKPLIQPPKTPTRPFLYLSPQTHNSPRLTSNVFKTSTKRPKEKSTYSKLSKLSHLSKLTSKDSLSGKTQEIFQQIVFNIKATRSSFNLSTKQLKSEETVKSPLSSSSNAAISSSSRQQTRNIYKFGIDTYELRHLTKFDVMRKVLAAACHYKVLNMKSVSLNRIKECFPGVPYGLKDSKKFVKFVKEGEIFAVAKMLQDNKWLAHTFDMSGQTALHWAVIRGHFEIVKMLLEYKAFVDVNDFV